LGPVIRNPGLLTIPHLCPILLASLPPVAVRWLLGVWVFALGGAIGSFLNVVVYRLPAGRSLIWPGSYCPACGHPIRWYDNVPILAWFFLRGRCRDCGAPISPRYPIVEAITAGLFLTLGVAEGFSGGANLPVRSLQVVDGVILVAYTSDQLAGLVFYHLLLLCTLLCAALIEQDGHRAPVRLAVPALAAGWLAPLVYPQLHPVPAWRGLTDLRGGAVDLSGSLAAAVDSTAGLGWAVVLGLAVWRIIEPDRRRGFLVGLACVGLFLGWQAVTVLAIVSAAIHLGLRRLRRLWPRAASDVPITWLALAALAWILAWKPLWDCWPFLQAGW